MASIDDLIEKFKHLPPEKRREVIALVESLLEQNSAKKGNGLKISWAGRLREHRDTFTSLDLERRASEWRA